MNAPRRRRRPTQLPKLPPPGQHQVERNLNSYGDLISSRLGGLSRSGTRMRIVKLPPSKRVVPPTLLMRILRWLKWTSR